MTPVNTVRRYNKSIGIIMKESMKLELYEQAETLDLRFAEYLREILRLYIDEDFTQLKQLRKKSKKPIDPDVTD